MQPIPQTAVTESIAPILKGDLTKAAQASRQLQQRHPKQGDAWFALAMCQLIEANDSALRHSIGQCRALGCSPYVGQMYLALQSHLAQNHEQTLIHAVAAHNLNPQLPFALIVAARSQTRLDRFTEAFHNFSKACAMFDAPPHLLPTIRIERLRCLEQIEATKFSEPLADGAIEYLQQTFLNHTQISRLVSSLIVKQLALDTANPVTDFDTIASNRLLTMALDRLILRDAQLELLLIQVRQYLLVQLYQQTSISDALLEFACRLAMQCFYNEYVYDELSDETQLIDSLLAAIETAPDDTAMTATPAQITHHLLAVALYRPLHTIRGIEQLAVTQQHTLAPLITATVRNPQRERELAATIPALDTVSNDISLRVQAQYEQNPYPRWISFDQLILRKNYFEANTGDCAVKPTHQPSAKRPTRILVAGCGTGQHAISIAKRYDHVMVTAIDISMASLAYAKRMAQQYQVHNIDFMQCDILKIAALKQQFDVIESVGTLHHMQSPDDGLHALTTVLAPGGILRLGLYSQLARQNINNIRASKTCELIAQFDMAQFRHVRNQIMQQLTGDPILDVADFFCTSGCRDLLCHVHEHQYSIASLKQLLDNCGLHFEGFNFQSGRSLGRLLYKRRYGEGPNGGAPSNKMHQLDRWAPIEDEAPDLFAEMYIFFART